MNAITQRCLVLLMLAALAACKRDGADTPAAGQPAVPAAKPAAAARIPVSVLALGAVRGS